MSRILESKVVCLSVCAVFALAVSISVLTGGSVPSLGTGLLPQPGSTTISQSPFPPPPDPEAPPMQLAQSPFPPPDPEAPPMQLAQSPFPPPDPEAPPIA